MRTGSDSKKLTLVYLQELFLQKTDKTHYIRMPEILSFLESKDIFVDRRTIYTDLKLLNYSGFEIVGVQEKGGYKYHHPSKTFNANELKFLIDSVAASKFLTEKKSKELINKIKTMGSSYEADSLNRTVLLSKRIKSMNDTVLKNLDSLYFAIAENSQISFQYMKWNAQRKLEFMRSGKNFITSPFAISLNDDNYYLVAYDSRTEELRHYRVDKMKSIKPTYEPREGKDLFKSFNVVEYSQKTFGMYGGKEETVSLEVPNNLAGVFIDRFGDSLYIRKNFDNPDTFIAKIDVAISPQFFGWLCGLGSKVKITFPESVKEEYSNYLQDILSNYNRD